MKQAELIPAEGSAPVPATDAGSIMAVISRAASDPSVDVDKLERLLSMYERINLGQAKADFAAAMSRVQAHLPTVVKDALNTQTSSKYARHETLSRALKPIYTKEGFSIEFSEGDAPTPEVIRIVGVLRHASGYEVTRHIDLKLDDVGIKGAVNKTAVHAKGSTFSYGRRYLTLMLFDVATGDDDDGNAAGDAAPISEEQLGILRDYLTATNSAEGKFCRWLKVEKLEDLPEDRFGRAVAELKKVQKRQEQP